MRTKLGTFRYPVEVGNAGRDTFAAVEPLVDTGALYSQFPTSFLESLGHRSDSIRQFRLANGSLIQRPIGDVSIRIAGEVRAVTCIFGEEGRELLLGATTLEAFSLAPDPVNETLTPVVAMLASLAPAEL